MFIFFQIILENKAKRSGKYSRKSTNKRRERREIFLKIIIHKYRKGIKLKYI
jgi:hypothetical protein